MVLTKQPNRYEIGSEQVGLYIEMLTWCIEEVGNPNLEYSYLDDTYYVQFDNPDDEARFILKWR